MDGNQITLVLNFFAQYSRCFTLEEVADFADSDSEYERLQQALLANPSFTSLEEEASAEKHFIPRKGLFQWFCRLSIRLAQAKQTRLDKRQLALLISSLRIDGRWDIPPMEAIQFGSHFGFVGPAWTPDEYVFPLAHILSFTQDPTKVASIVMENFTAEGKAHLVFEQLAQELTQDGLSEFTKRQRYVIEAREGLLTGRRMTLQQIGDRLGITRERVRQIEAEFWYKLHHCLRGRSPTLLFSTASVYYIISKQSCLLVSKNSAEIFLASFLAKCIGIPQAEFPHAGVVLLGATQKDVVLPKFTRTFQENINVNFIATRLEHNGQFCLTHSDITALAENIAQFHRKRLTKRQKVYLALRTIGKPAHCSEITEVYNSLFPSEPSTEHNLHAVLSHEQYGVVWIGIRSTFALKEWGYEHPPETLFDTVTEIVEQRYKETGQPVPFTVIVAEIGKCRRLVNPASLVIATQCNHKLRRVGKDSFVPQEPSEEIQEEISAEELDRILRKFEKESGKRAIDQKATSNFEEKHHTP